MMYVNLCFQREGIWQNKGVSEFRCVFNSNVISLMILW